MSHVQVPPTGNPNQFADLIQGVGYSFNQNPPQSAHSNHNYMAVKQQRQPINLPMSSIKEN
jgi:hypothetical protein